MRVCPRFSHQYSAMISSWRKRRAERHATKKKDMEENGGLELIIPRHFLCPISLDLMKDPVTLSSGITYDRENIERWIESGNFTCPITNQPLTSLEPIPNHAIRKMIQEWCVQKRSYGIERIPTPRIPMSSFEITEILARIEANRDIGDAEGCKELVVKIKALAKESERNKKCIMMNGTGRVLSATFQAFSNHFLVESIAALDDILSALAMLSPLDGDALSCLGSSSSLNGIIWFLNSEDLSARRNAILVLQQILSSDHHQQKIDEVLEIEGALEGLLKLIREPISPSTTKATLLTMYHMVSSSSSPPSSAYEKASEKFVGMGLVEMLLELLVDSEKSICEKALGVFDGICSFPQGREKAYENVLSVPVMVKKLFRVSDLATEFSVSILWKLGKNIHDQGNEEVLVEALQVGAFQKLLLLLQVGCGEATKEKATEVLKLLNPHRFKAECTESLDFKDLKRPF